MIYSNLEKQNLQIYGSLSKNVYIDKSDDIVNEYNNIHHVTIKMKPIVKSNLYIAFGVENDDKGPKFNVSGHVRISKYKIFLQKAMLQIGFKKFL